LATSADAEGAFIFVEASGEAIGPSALHVHHDHDEAMYILEGEVVVTIDDEEYQLGPGDFAFLPKGVPHRLDFRTPARWLLVGSGGYEESRGNLYGAFVGGRSASEIYSKIKDVDFVSE
jgi:glyoxylate utilization-related uncharacterized protein